MVHNLCIAVRCRCEIEPGDGERRGREGERGREQGLRMDGRSGSLSFTRFRQKEGWDLDSSHGNRMKIEGILSKEQTV